MAVKLATARAIKFRVPAPVVDQLKRKSTNPEHAAVLGAIGFTAAGVKAGTIAAGIAALAAKTGVGASLCKSAGVVATVGFTHGQAATVVGMSTAKWGATGVAANVKVQSSESAQNESVRNAVGGIYDAIESSELRAPASGISSPSTSNTTDFAQSQAQPAPAQGGHPHPLGSEADMSDQSLYAQRDKHV